MADDPRTVPGDDALDDATLEALAEAVATAPPGELRGRLLDAARAERPGAPVPGVGPDAARNAAALRRWRVVGSVAAGAALVLGGLLARETTRTTEERTARSIAEAARDMARETVATLEAQLATQGRELVALRASVAAQAEILRVVGGPVPVVATLAPTEGGGGAGRVHFDPKSGNGAVVVAGLAAPPTGKVYELWALRDGVPPEPAGLLVPQDDVAVAAVRGVTQRGRVTAFAVSLEPAGGSASPTGPIVLMGATARS